MQKFSNLPKVTQLVNGRTWIRTRYCAFESVILASWQFYLSQDNSLDLKISALLRNLILNVNSRILTSYFFFALFCNNLISPQADGCSGFTMGKGHIL